MKFLQDLHVGGPLTYLQRRNVLKKVGRDDTRPRKANKRKNADAAKDSENQAPPVRNKRARKLADPAEYDHLEGADHYDDENNVMYRVLRIEINAKDYFVAIRKKIKKDGSLDKIEDDVFAESVLYMPSEKPSLNVGSSKKNVKMSFNSSKV